MGTRVIVVQVFILARAVWRRRRIVGWRWYLFRDNVYPVFGGSALAVTQQNTDSQEAECRSTR